MSFLHELFLSHPQEKGLSYFAHSKKAVKMSFQLFIASIALMIHAIFPKYFQHVGSDTVDRLYIEELKEKNKE